MTAYGQWLGGSPRQWDVARDVRRMYGVHFYMGRNGASKSLCAVFDTMPDLEEGVPVLSTVRLLDWKNPRPCDDLSCECDKADDSRHRAAHPQYRRWTRWDQMLDLRNGVLLADEVVGVADSSEGGLPPQVVRELHQLRRRHVVLRMTGLNFTRAHKRIREATTAVTRCGSSFPEPVLSETGEYQPWRPRRLARMVTYDAKSLPIDDLTESAFDKADVLTWGRVWIPSIDARNAYDTWDTVDQIGTITDAGSCAHCSGRRTRPECTCPDYQETLAEQKARQAARRSARREASSTAGQPDGSADWTPAPDESALPVVDVTDRAAALV